MCVITWFFFSDRSLKLYPFYVCFDGDLLGKANWMSLKKTVMPRPVRIWFFEHVGHSYADENSRM